MDRICCGCDGEVPDPTDSWDAPGTGINKVTWGFSVLLGLANVASKFFWVFEHRNCNTEGATSAPDASPFWPLTIYVLSYSIVLLPLMAKLSWDALHGTAAGLSRGGPLNMSMFLNATIVMWFDAPTLLFATALAAENDSAWELSTLISVILGLVSIAFHWHSLAYNPSRSAWHGIFERILTSTTTLGFFCVLVALPAFRSITIKSSNASVVLPMWFLALVEGPAFLMISRGCAGTTRVKAFWHPMDWFPRGDSGIRKFLPDLSEYHTAIQIILYLFIAESLPMWIAAGCLLYVFAPWGIVLSRQNRNWSFFPDGVLMLGHLAFSIARAVLLYQMADTEPDASLAPLAQVLGLIAVACASSAALIVLIGAIVEKVMNRL